MLDAMGWAATAVSLSSYLFRSTVTLRRVQALASAIWIIYGLLIHAQPLVAANVLVGGVAMYSSLMESRRARLSEKVSSAANAQM